VMLLGDALDRLEELGTQLLQTKHWGGGDGVDFSGHC
jgi:hypothetical protein